MSADRPKIRAVFDCMVFLQGAARRESAAGACLLLLRQKFPALTDQSVDRFVTAIERRAVAVSEIPRVFKFDRDPKDAPYINLAIAARAGYLVSRDKDILDLADASTADGERLQHVAPELRILDPVAFLVAIRQSLESPSGD